MGLRGLINELTLGKATRYNQIPNNNNNNNNNNNSCGRLWKCADMNFFDNNEIIKINN